jgi:hypothetical protein
MADAHREMRLLPVSGWLLVPLNPRAAPPAVQSCCRWG